MTSAQLQPPRGRVALFGDVGGHSKQLRKALIELGADPETMRLPADLTVIQVGDLIHRGPDRQAPCGWPIRRWQHSPGNGCNWREITRRSI